MTNDGLDQLLGLESLLDTALDRLAPMDVSKVLQRIVAAFQTLTNDRAKQAVRGRVLAFFEQTVVSMLRGDRLDKIEPFVCRFADAVRGTSLVAGHPLGRVLRQVEQQMAASRRAAAEGSGLMASATGEEVDERAEAFIRRLVGRRDLAASIAVSRVLGLDAEARSRRFVARFENRILRMNLGLLRRFDDAMQITDKALSFDRRFQMLGSLLAGTDDEGELGQFSWVLGLDLASGLADGYDGELVGVEDLVFAHPAFQGDGSDGLLGGALDGIGSLGLGGLARGGLDLSSLGKLRRTGGLGALDKPVTKIAGSDRLSAARRGSAELPTVKARFGGRMITLPKDAVKALRSGDLGRFERSIRSGLPAAAARSVLRSVRRQASSSGIGHGARLQLKGMRGAVSGRMGGLSHLALGFQGLEAGRARRQAASDLGKLVGRGGGAIGMVLPRLHGSNLGRGSVLGGGVLGGSALQGLAQTGMLSASAISPSLRGAGAGLSSLGRAPAGSPSFALPPRGVSGLGSLRHSQVMELAARGQIAPSVARMLLSAPRAGASAAPHAGRSVAAFAVASDGFGVPRFRAARRISAAGIAALGGLDLGGSLVVRASSARRGAAGGVRFAGGAAAPARYGAAAVGGGYSTAGRRAGVSGSGLGASPARTSFASQAAGGGVRLSRGFGLSSGLGIPSGLGVSGGMRRSLGAQLGAFGGADLRGGYVRDGFGRIRPARTRGAIGNDLSVIDLASGGARVRVGGASSSLGGLRPASGLIAGAPALSLSMGRVVAPALSLASGLGAFRGLVGGRRAGGSTVSATETLIAPHAVAGGLGGAGLGGLSLGSVQAAGMTYGGAAQLRRAGAGAFRLSSFDVAVGGGVASLADLQGLAALQQAGGLPRGRGRAASASRGGRPSSAARGGRGTSDWVVAYDAERAGVTRMGAAAARDRQGAGFAASRVARFGQHATHLRDVYSGRRLSGAAMRSASGAASGSQRMEQAASAVAAGQLLVAGGHAGGAAQGMALRGGAIAGAQALHGAAGAHGSSQMLASVAGAAASGQALHHGGGAAVSGQALLASRGAAAGGRFSAEGSFAGGAGGGSYLPARRAARRSAPRLMGVYGAPEAGFGSGAADGGDVLGLRAAGGFAARRAPARMAQRLALLGLDAGEDGALVAQAFSARGRRLDRHTGARLRPYVGDVVDRARVHQGPAVDRVARALNTEAFAVGEDVFFATGANDTTTREGISRVAHELSHAARPQRSLHRLRDHSSAPGEAAAESVARRAAVRAPAAVEPGLVYGLIPKQISGQVRDRFRLDGWSPAQELSAQAGRLSAGLGGSLPGERGVDLRIEHSFVRFHGDLPAGGSAAAVPVDLTSQLTGRTEIVARSAEAKVQRGVSFALRNFEVPTQALFWGRTEAGEVEHRSVPVALRYRTLEPERVWNELELEGEGGARRGRARYQVRSERLGAPEGQLLEGGPAAQIRQVSGEVAYHGQNVHVGADFGPRRTDVRWSGGLGADVADSEGFRRHISRAPFSITLTQDRQEALGLDLTRAKALLRHNLDAVREARRLHRAGVKTPVGNRWALYLQAAPEGSPQAPEGPVGEGHTGWGGAPLRTADLGSRSMSASQAGPAGRLVQTDGAPDDATGYARRIAGATAPEQTLVQVGPGADRLAQSEAARDSARASEQEWRAGGRAVTRAQRAPARAQPTHGSQVASARSASGSKSVSWVAPTRHQSSAPAKTERRIYGFGGIEAEPVAGVQRKASTHWVADTKMQPGQHGGDRLARPEESRRPAAPPPNLTQLVYQIYNRLKREMEIDCERRTGAF